MTDRPRGLDDWLRHAEQVHPVGIDLGLERIAQVADRLGFVPPDHRPAPRALIVAGTNGKGSTCMALETLLRQAGLRVGTTLSPHVHRFNERVRLEGEDADDATLCRAFATVEAARGDVPLTYFEFSALVALLTFRSEAVDVAVLEVGLGGRLDAFNLVGADVAVITSIALDHEAWLGRDLEGIGREKAGVLRPGRRVVLGADVTASVVQAAADLGCVVTRLGRDFDVRERRDDWDFLGDPPLAGIPRGALAPANCALAIEAARHLAPVDAAGARRLGAVSLPGRQERWQLGPVPLWLDVAHNPAGAAFLARQLAARDAGRRFVALLGMLDDKDAAGVAAAFGDRVRYWVCVPTSGSRGLSGTALAGRLGVGDRAVAAAQAREGLARALSLRGEGDGILAFGSFSVVEQVRDLLREGFAGAERQLPASASGSADVPDSSTLDAAS